MVTTGKRGQPLVAIVSLLVGYSVLRTAFWTPLLDAIPNPLVEAIETIAHTATPAQALAASEPIPAGSGYPQSVVRREPVWRDDATGHVDTAARTNGPRSDARYVTGHSRMRLAAMSGWPQAIRQASNLAFTGQGDLGEKPAGPVAPGIRTPSRARFSGDAWLFARMGGGPVDAVAPALANYGASQTGAVLRYALAPNTRLRPELYGRVVAALAGPAQQDAAFGLSARPLADLPLRLHAEARVTRQGADSGRETFVRPSIFATAGVYSDDPQTQVKTRGYAQAGYVGGRAGTAFADGQIVAERTVARFDLGEVAVGAGAWGGVQRGAGRLDIGPSASVAVRLGEAPARLSADYRFRIAGNAQPGSGAALTLSTGF